MENAFSYVFGVGEAGGGMARAEMREGTIAKNAAARIKMEPS